MNEIYFLIGAIVFGLLMRWLLRINHICKRLDEIAKAVKPVQDQRIDLRGS